MGRARRQINYDQGFSHIVFRTNSGEFFFQSRFIKMTMIYAAKKYKDEYGIKIVDYCLMSNHAHFTMYYPTVDALSRFMHDMNLFIAKTVNGFFERRGKAISDRFRSPVICDVNYYKKVTEYIWMNPVKAKMLSIKKAQDYEFCSLYYRHRGIKDPLAESYKEIESLTGLRIVPNGVSERKFAIDLLNELKSKALKENEDSIFEHLHTIGPVEFIKERLRSFKEPKEDPPPEPDSS